MSNVERVRLMRGSTWISYRVEVAGVEIAFTSVDHLNAGSNHSSGTSTLHDFGGDSEFDFLTTTSTAH